MTKHFFWLFIFLCIGVNANGKNQDQKVDQLIKLSGIEVQAQSIPDHVKANIQQMAQQSKLPTPKVNALLAATEQTVKPELIMAELRSGYIEQLSKRDIKKLLKWHKTPLGGQLAEAEKAASTQAAFQAMMQQAPSLMQDAERVEFAKKLDELTATTDSMVAIQEKMAIVAYTSIMSALQPGKPVDTSAYQAQLKTMEAQTRLQLEQIVVLSGVYAYRSFTPEQLAEYEAHLKTPSAKKFYQISLERLGIALEKIVGQFSTALTKPTN